MKPKHLILLGIVFIALISALFVKKIFVRPEIEIEEYASLEISVEPDQVYAVEISKGETGEPLRIERKSSEGSWQIPAKWNVKAKKDKMDKLLGDLSGLQGELRSNSPELFDDFGISDGQAVAIKTFDSVNDAIHSFLVGTKESGFGMAFLREAGSNKVYLVNKRLLSAVGIYGSPETALIDTDSWVDLLITKIDTEKIKSVMITKSEAGSKEIPVDIKKETDAETGAEIWVTGSAELEHGLDGEKIKNFIKSLNNMYGTSALDPEGEGYGFDNPFITCTLGQTEGDLKIGIGNKLSEEGDDRYLKSPEAYVYSAKKYITDRLDITIEKFKAEPPPEPEPAEEETKEEPAS